MDGLEPLLKEINVACCFNLLVVAGACEGLGLAVILQALDRAPVWGILGPTRTVTAGELDDGHRAFYRTLYETCDFTPALDAMNLSVTAGDRPFVLFGAQWFFAQVMRGYFDRYSTEDAIAERVKKAAPREKALREQECRQRKFSAGGKRSANICEIIEGTLTEGSPSSSRTTYAQRTRLDSRFRLRMSIHLPGTSMPAPAQGHGRREPLTGED